MNNRTCNFDGCDRPHLARGMCSSHYATWHRHTHGRNDATFERTCVTCGCRWTTRRKVAKFCSDQCKGMHYRATTKTRCKLPPDHPAMMQIAEAKAQARKASKRAAANKAASRVDKRTPRECPGCACWFSPLHHSAATQMVTCSKFCNARVHRRRRRAREHNATGTWTWSEFMRIARKFHYCCAYCGTKPDRLDPDHVVPLSRGGADAPSNLLPTCMLCNSSKCAMTLSEWASWLACRGLPERRTSWQEGDARYTHLTDALLRTPVAA